MNFQQPSSKWAFAQSYSWVVSNYGDTFDPQTQQAQTQAQIQQQMQQLALEQQARQAQNQQALQQQALQAQIQQQMQQQALQAQIQQQIQQQALNAQAQQQAVENARLQREKQTVPLNRFNSQSNSNRDYTITNEPKGHVLRNAQTENMAPLMSEQRNENTQGFIDEIVRKVIQETRGEFGLPTTREEIEKIVRRILLENSSNKRDTSSATNLMDGYLNNVQASNNDRNPYGMNHNDLAETFSPSKSSTYPITPTAQANPQAECIFNCRYSHRDGQPIIAIAAANAFYPINRSKDPIMVANSFTYTSV